MAIIKKLPLILLLLVFLQTSGMAQVLTIIPDLSDAYVDKLINTAKQYYPKVRSNQTRVDMAKSTIAKNKLSLLDAVTVSYVYQPSSTATIDPTNPATSYFKGLQAGMFLNLGTLITRPFSTKVAKQELQLAQNDQEEYLITLTTMVKKRYYTYVELLAQIKLITKSTLDAESSLKDLKLKFEKGEETYDNYSKAQMQYNDHQSSKLAAEASLFMAKADLEELLGTKLENVK